MRTSDQWQKTFDAVTDLIMILDQDFKIKRVNKAAAEFFKLAAGDLAGKVCYKLMNGTDAPPEECPFGKMMFTNEHQEAEIFVGNKGIWIYVSVDPILDDEGRIVEVVHIIKDITDRKEKEELFRKGEERYRSLFNDSPIGLLEINASAIKKHLNKLLDSGITDLKQYFDDHPEEILFCWSLISIVDINKALLNFYGFKSKKEYFDSLRNIVSGDFSPNELFINALSAVPTTASKDEFRDTLVSFGRGKTVYETEVSVKTGRNAECRYFNIRWSIPVGYEDTYTRVLISMMDITNLRNAEAALTESEEKYRTVVEKSLAGFFIVQDNLFRFVNQRLCEMTGYCYDEIVDKLSPADLTHPDDRPKLADSMINHLNGAAVSHEDELRTVRKDGTIIITKILVDNILYNGKTASMGAVIDVTKERNLEFQLRQAHKMEAIGTLAGGIAHDFNNLLMTILGYTSLSLTDPNLDSVNRDYLKIIEEQVQKGADLTRQLLGFARGGKYEVKPTNLNDLLGQTAEMFGRTKKEIRIFNKREENIWTVDVDRGQIEQVLLNLFVNAWQAMPAGGDLYLETSNVVIDANHSRSSYLAPGRYVKLSVTDQGAGMDEVTRQRIFEPFFTTKEMGRGTGLGLASAYGIIKNHGGIINVYSEKGQGTTFNIYLPVSDKEVLKEKVATHKALKGSETVLVIDDQKPVIDVGERMLKALGYEVLTSENGEDAIAIYQKQQKKIDLVILDMIMPGMSGSEVFDALKTINPQIKVVLSSGYSMNGQASSILARGCNGFIQKPFSLVDLSRKIREVLDEAPLAP